MKATFRLLVVGATSAIAHEVSRRYASRHARLFLAGRDAAGVATNAADLTVRGAETVRTGAFNALDSSSHEALLEAAFLSFGGFDAVLVAYGLLPDQLGCEQSVAETLVAFDTNGRSVVALLTLLANRFETQGSGTIVVVSSPAADRGRASNYVYGAAKAAVSVFASGLRNRLYAKGVRVLTVSPGFVDTPMTVAFPKGPLWTSPKRVARDIEHAIDSGFGVVYTPWFWRWIMRVIRLLPERLFVRLKL